MYEERTRPGDPVATDTAAAIAVLEPPAVPEPPAAPEPSAPDPGIVDALPEIYGLDDRGENRILRRTLTVALIFHAIFLVIHFPSFGDPKPLPEPKLGKLYQVQTMRFKPPAPQPAKKAPKPKARKIPIPDPTPDEPEPIEVAELDVPEIESESFEDFVFGIPDAPPGPATGGPGAPLQVGGDVRPPVKIHAPQPLYTEEARKARIQGAVILQTVIDTLGNVTDVKVIKGLTLGLSESAIETVLGWQFQPATRNGEPVPVYYNLIVTFRVQ